MILKIFVSLKNQKCSARMNNNLHFDILPKEQRELWKDLHQVPKDFTMYGVTALALQIGHRISIDFDFFTNNKFDPLDLQQNIPFLKKAEILQNTSNTLTCLVYRLELPIKVSFLCNLELPKLHKDIIVDGVHIASCEDVLTTKLKTILDRPSFKDYQDISTGLEQGYELSKLLNNTQLLYGSHFNKNLSLKALTFFDDILNIDNNIKEALKTHVIKYEKVRTLNLYKNHLENKDLERIAKRVVWFKKPEETLKDKRCFLTYLMTYGTDKDTDIARKYFTIKDFIEVLKDPEIGVFDKKSWKYWNLVFLDPKVIPPLPKRNFSKYPSISQKPVKYNIKPQFVL